jgi:hypothetical protein
VIGLRMTEAEYRAHLNSRGKVTEIDLPLEKPSAPKFRSKTEARFVQEFILPKIHRQEIKAWWYEAETWKLGADLRYTPDFLTVGQGDELTYYEIKGGFIRDTGRAKLLAAATMFPFKRLILAQYDKKAWSFKTIQSNPHG